MAKYLHGTVAVKDDKKYTYADYVNWPEGEHWELIDGDAYDMAPAPGTMHQRFAAKIMGEFSLFLKGKECEWFPAPFDVLLPNDETETEEETSTVVQPDIVVVCDKSRLTEKGCVGAPDLVVEILSPSTAYKDETRKLQLYEKHGVREYWIVNPQRPLVMVYILKNGVYAKPAVYDEHDTLPSSVLEGLILDLGEVFAQT